MSTNVLKAKNMKSHGHIAGRIGKFILYFFLILIAVIQILPIIWLFLFSLKNNNQIFSGAPFGLPNPVEWVNYVQAWTIGHVGMYFLNSTLYTVVSALLTMIFASMVTFAITRMKWKLSSLVLGMFMLAMMIPVHATLIPLFSEFSKVGLVNNPIGIILLYTAFNMPITIMILYGFYQTFPREIEEAAVMDGASINRIFFKMTLPMTMPVVATGLIINMIYDWNEFIFVNTFINSANLQTLTVGVQNFVGEYSTNWGAIGATLAISILPILITFLLLSDRIVEGMTAGSVKG
jgi:raffinose/stachyose/melibiose transport system permease protein